VSKSKFVAIEHEVLKLWEREKCFQRLVEKNHGKPRWSFLDGPITANNPMGVHQGHFPALSGDDRA
jgi:isoleucyl-tRNA synthetase